MQNYLCQLNHASQVRVNNKTSMKPPKTNSLGPKNMMIENIQTSNEYRVSEELFLGGVFFFCFFRLVFRECIKGWSSNSTWFHFQFSKRPCEAIRPISLIAKSNDEVIFVEGFFKGTFSKDCSFHFPMGRGSS